MNYDYRFYFQEITGDLDSILTGQSDFRTEIRDYFDSVNEKLDILNNSFNSGITILSAMILVSACLKVFFG